MLFSCVDSLQQKQPSLTDEEAQDLWLSIRSFMDDQLGISFTKDFLTNIDCSNIRESICSKVKLALPKLMLPNPQHVYTSFVHDLDLFLEYYNVKKIIPEIPSERLFYKSIVKSSIKEGIELESSRAKLEMLRRQEKQLDQIQNSPISYHNEEFIEMENATNRELADLFYLVGVLNDEIKKNNTPGFILNPKASTV